MAESSKTQARANRKHNTSAIQATQSNIQLKYNNNKSEPVLDKSQRLNNNLSLNSTLPISKKQGRKRKPDTNQTNSISEVFIKKSKKSEPIKTSSFEPRITRSTSRRLFNSSDHTNITGEHLSITEERSISSRSSQGQSDRSSQDQSDRSLASSSSRGQSPNRKKEIIEKSAHLEKKKIIARSKATSPAPQPAPKLSTNKGPLNKIKGRAKNITPDTSSISPPITSGGLSPRTAKNQPLKTGSCASRRRGSVVVSSGKSATSVSDSIAGASSTLPGPSSYRLLMSNTSSNNLIPSNEIPLSSAGFAASSQNANSSSNSAAASTPATLGSFTSLIQSLDQDSGDVSRLQALLEARGLPTHLFGSLGPRMHQILHRSMMGGSVAKAQQLLQSLQSQDETQQLSAVIEMCQLLVMGNEDTLAGFPIRQVVPVLINLLRMEHNFDVMHHACRALTYMMEALPRSTSVVVDAVPVFLEKLQSIECMDVAEQSLQALEMLSKKHNKAILHHDGVLSCLTYVDFFSIAAQRASFNIAANCCQSMTPEEFTYVQQSLSLLTSRLTQSDKKSLENVCMCMARLVDNFQTDENILKEIAGNDFLPNIQQLLMTSPQIINGTIFVTILRMLVLICTNCPYLAVKLLKQNVSEMLCFLLVGSANGTASQNIELIHRTPQELYEIVCLIGELLPQLPTTGIFSVDSLFCKVNGGSIGDMVAWQWLDDQGLWHSYSNIDCRIIEAAYQTGEQEVSLTIVGGNYTLDFEAMQQINEDTSTARPVQRKLNPQLPNNTNQIKSSQQISMVKIDAREELLKEVPFHSASFIKTMFGILYEVYASSAGPSVRHKCLRSLLRMLYYGTPDLLSIILATSNVSSHIAAMMASSDLKIMVAGIQMAFILMDKLPDVFSVYFCREGVMHQVKLLSETNNLEAIDLSTKKESSNLIATGNYSNSASFLPTNAYINSGHRYAMLETPNLVANIEGLMADCNQLLASSHQMLASNNQISSSSNHHVTSRNPHVIPTSHIVTSSNNLVDDKLTAEEIVSSQSSSFSTRGKMTIAKLRKPLHNSSTLLDPHSAAPMPPLVHSQSPSIFIAPPPEYAGAMLSHQPYIMPHFAPGKMVSSRLRKASDAMVPTSNHNEPIAESNSNVSPRLLTGDLKHKKVIKRGPLSSSSRKSKSDPMAPELYSLLNEPSTSASITSSGSQNKGRGTWLSNSKGASFFAGFHPSRWGRQSNSTTVPPVDFHSISQPASPSAQSLYPQMFYHHQQDSFQPPLPPLRPYLVDNKDKIKKWIAEQASKFCEKYYDGVVSEKLTGKHPALTSLNQLTSAAEALINHPHAQALQHVGHILMDADLSPFEIIHSNIIPAITTFLTQSSLTNLNNPKTFFTVFLGSQLTDALLNNNLSSINTQLFAILVNKLLMCFHHLEQFHVKVHDFPMTLGTNRRGSNTMRFFDTHQLKCILQRHPSCSSLKQWKGGPVKIDPLALVQTIEKYLVMRGYARTRMSTLSTCSDDDDVSDDDIDDTMAAFTIAHTSSRHRLQLLINDVVLPYNMTVYEAIRQHAKMSSSSAHAQLDSSENETENENLYGGNYIWTTTHTIWFRPAPDSEITLDSSATNFKKSKFEKTKTRVSSKTVKEWEAMCVSVFEDILIGVLPPSVTVDDASLYILVLLRILHGLNQHWGILFEKPGASPLLGAQEFVSSKLTAKMNRQLQDPLVLMTANLPPWMLQIARACPFLFPFETRQMLFYATTFDRDRALQRLHQMDATLDVQASNSSDRVAPRVERKKSVVSRNDILKQAEKIMSELLNPKAILEIQYENEAGTGLGPTLEFYALISREMQRADLELWRGEHIRIQDNEKTDKSEFYIHSNTGLFPFPLAKSTKSTQITKIKSKFKFLGKFMAKALMDYRMLDIPLSETFYKWLLGMEGQLGIEDLPHVQPAISSTILQLIQLLKQKKTILQDVTHNESSREMALESLTVDGCNIEDLCLDFVLPGHPHIELKKGGKDISLTIHNLEEYLKLLLHWTLVEGCQRQFDALREGFESIFPLSSLCLFYHDELEQLFCGSSHEKWTDKYLSEVCRVDHGYTLESKPILLLFEIMSKFDAQQQRSFIQFVTGSPRLPVGGLKSLNPPLTIVRKAVESNENADDFLPSVMTCVNYLKLPDYSSIDIMQAKLHFAATEGQQSFHLS